MRLLAIATSLVAAASLALACDPTSTASASTASDPGGNCVTCHLADYQKVADPVHVDHKPTTCAVCHVQDGWRPSALHHDWWALTGAHEKADCMYCHGHKDAPTVFKGTTKECVKCHQPEYDSSTYPNHQTFPTKCADCHTTKAFRPATFTPPPPPVVVAPIATVAPLATVPGHPGKLPKTPSGKQPIPVPVTPPTTPRVPTTPPPPDVTSRPSPRR